MEAQTNVAVAVASQIIAYLKNGTIINAVNVPSVTGELLTQMSPYLTLAEQMGSLQAQLAKGALKEVVIEYAGDFKGLDMSPVTTAMLKGLLAHVVKDDVNFVNAHVFATERGIKVTETATADAGEYINLITVRSITPETTNTVSGTLFGKNEVRVVKINNFRLELIPYGHLALIHNIDKPGAIGSFATCLGKNNINIDLMQVGQDESGEHNIIFLKTNISIPENVRKELLDLPLIKTVIPLEFPEERTSFIG